MRLLDLFKKKEAPSQEERDRELTLAIRSLKAAKQAGTLSDAMPHIKRYQEIVKKSTQKESFTPEDAQGIIGTYVLQHAANTFPRINIFPDINKNDPTLDEAVDMAILDLRELANGSMDEVQARKEALRQGYTDALMQKALFMIKNVGKDGVEAPVVVRDYEALVAAYHEQIQEDVPFMIVSDGENEIPLQRTFYRSAANDHLSLIIGNINNNDEKEIAKDHFGEWLEQSLRELEHFHAYAEFDEEEEKQAEANLKRPREIREEAIAAKEEEILKEQNGWYESLELFCENPNGSADPRVDAYKLLNGLVTFTGDYATILEESPEEAHAAGEALIKQYLPEPTAETAE